MSEDLERRCPACGEGALWPQLGSQRVEYKGIGYELPVHYAACDACGSDVAGPEESRANKRTVQALQERR